MTRDGAASTARNMAITFGVGFVVYRLPLWPAGVFGVVREDRGLPPQAETVERFGPVPVHVPAAPEPQGSLF